MLKVEDTYEATEQRLFMNMNNVKWHNAKKEDVIKFGYLLEDLNRKSNSLDVVTSSMMTTFLILMGHGTVMMLGFAFGAPASWLLMGANFGIALLFLFMTSSRMKVLSRHKLIENEAFLLLKKMEDDSQIDE